VLELPPPVLELPPPVLELPPPVLALPPPSPPVPVELPHPTKAAAKKATASLKFMVPILPNGSATISAGSHQAMWFLADTV
jgi:hypothetical protein